MKLKITFEISEKDLAKAILPQGASITELEIKEVRQRRSSRNTQQSEEAPKKRGRPKKSASSE